MKSRIAPHEAFPDVGSLPTEQVEVLNSKVHRELDFEYATDGEAHPETEFRLEEVNEELDLRDMLET
ncbi:hypothetical protein ACX80H_05320 [Arthrobacter sp. MDT2-2]